MKPIYQTGWMGIRYDSFCRPSSTEIANLEFYNSFYRELFSRFKAYDDLEETWRTLKSEIAMVIGGSCLEGFRVLSVGCGVGYVEHCIQRDYKVELHVHDPALDSLRWLWGEMPEWKIHKEMGTIDGTFDLIYMSAVDYSMTDEVLIPFLKNLKVKLREGGLLLLIIGPRAKKFDRDNVRVDENTKGCQFLGWERTEDEYRELMNKVGCSNVRDGYVNTENQQTYFITGTGGLTGTLMEVITPDNNSISTMTRREKIEALEAEMLKLPQIELPIRHHFAEGLYGREVFIPAGALLTGRVHRSETLNIISTGEMSIFDENGTKRIKAPCTMVTPPNGKRVGYAHQDTLWITVHATTERDLDKLEDEFLSPTYQTGKSDILPEVWKCLE